MNEASSQAPAPRRLVPILIVVATLTATSWACATTLERSQFGAAADLVGSQVGAPADRLERSFTEQNGR